MKKIIFYTLNFIAFFGAIILVIRFIPYRGNVSTWQDIYDDLPFLLVMSLVLFIFTPKFQIKDKENKTLTDHQDEEN